MQVAGIVLAAGRASRMGGEKVFLPLLGRSLLLWVTEAALSGGCSPVRVVVRPKDVERAGVEFGRLKTPQIELRPNPHFENGLSTSVRAGLEEMPSNISGALFLLADQPLVGRDVVQRLIETHQTQPEDIIQPVYREQPGNPVLFPRSLWEHLLEVSGDEGGRTLLRRFPERLKRVRFDDPTLALDADTPEAFQKIQLLLEARQHVKNDKKNESGKMGV